MRKLLAVVVGVLLGCATIPGIIYLEGSTPFNVRGQYNYFACSDGRFVGYHGVVSSYALTLTDMQDGPHSQIHAPEVIVFTYLGTDKEGVSSFENEAGTFKLHRVLKGVVGTIEYVEGGSDVVGGVQAPLEKLADQANKAYPACRNSWLPSVNPNDLSRATN